MTASQVKVVSLGVLCVSLCEPLLLFARKLETQRLEDFLGNPFLHGEGVRELFLKPFSPQLRSTLHVGQLRLDDEAVANLRNVTGHNGAHAELVTRL